MPARDEQRLLPDLMGSLRALAVDPGRVTACIFLDGCMDDSDRVLRRAARAFPFPVVIEAGARRPGSNAGSARHAAMAMGLRSLDDRDGLLFSTDADSRPHETWIAAGDAALRIADVVAGRIVRIDAQADPVQSRIEIYYDRLHRLRRIIDPVPWEAPDPHHFAGGANMAIRASAYRLLGGFKPLAFGEDAVLLDEAARAGLRVRRDGAMLVDTSSRRIGRAAIGLASALQTLASGGVPMVEHPDGAAWQWQAQAAARRAFATIDRDDVRAVLGPRIGLTADHVLGVARDCPNGEAFAMRIVPAPPLQDRTVTLAVAEAALTVLEHDVYGIAA